MSRQTTAIFLLSSAFFLFESCSGNKGPDEFADLPSSQTTSAPAYDPSTATARVFGSIRLEGTPEEMSPVRVGGSRFCVLNKAYVTRQDVLVTGDGKLENVIVYVRSGYEGHSYTPPAEPALLDQEHCVYVPHVLTIMTNQQLKVRNSDDTFHNVHSMPMKNRAVNFAQASMGMEDTLSFAEPEPPFRIGCDVHGWMTTWVGVFDHPFHTTSRDTGTYELRLPPGKYEITAWHEKYGEQTMSVEVADNAETELNFGFSTATKEGN